MASIKPHNGKWRAFVFKAGVRKTKVFAVKARAVAWAASEEAEILSGKHGDVPDKTFGDLLEKYADEVSVTKRGERWERLRIGLTCRDEVSKVKLCDLDARSIAAWRDRRLTQVSAASVRREWNLLSNACSIAAKEWKWLKENPMREVRRPPPTDARDRIATASEIERILFCLGYVNSDTPITISARVGASVLFAIETAMRAGEIAGLKWEQVFLDKQFCRIAVGKTASAKRDVPLSGEAIRILNQVSRDNNPQGEVFGISTAQIDELFRKARTNALVEGLTFHDLRHTAITRLAKKLDVLALARMVGHRDLKMLMVYFNESAQDMAARL